MNVDVISKATGAVSQVSTGTINLGAPSIVRLDITRADVAGIERQGQDLVIRLANGEQVRVVDFYSADAAVSNDLVLREPDGTLWHARTTNTQVTFTQIEDLDDLAVVASGGGSSLALPAILAGVAGVAGLAAVAAGGGGGDDDDQPTQPNPGPGTGVTPDTTAPSSPTATVRGDGTVLNGTGEASATIQVRDASGAVIGTGVVGADGNYSVLLTSPQIKGDPVVVTQTDPAGNVSPGTTAATPDLTAPAAPSATVDETGTIVTGRGEPGATVTVTDSTVAVGTTVVAADGTFTLTLPTPRVDGTNLTIVQADAAGNVSGPVTIATPDLTAPVPPIIAIDATGTQVSGTGEPGAQVVITDPAGTTLATATVAADGSYTAILSTPQVDGEVIVARQTDAAGNASGTASTIAPDFTAPAQPTATISADGTSVAGIGEPGARIVFADTSGTVIGSATVAADGSYSTALTPAQANGEQLTATQVDAAGNAAPPLSLTAPDATAPLPPVATLDANGTIVTGSGEAGATVTVRDANGAVLGTATVGAQGNYAVTLATVQGNSETLSVTQADAAGNVSPAATLVAPDLTAPLAPTGIVAGDGTSISGSGEVGATVTIRSPVGAVIATAVVGADGTYVAVLTPAQVDGEVLTVRQADAAGNVSPTATATAPDLVLDDGPDAPTATVAADGTAVTGIAVAGAAITLYDADGTIIGTGIAGADGSYSVALTPARIDGETIGVTQADADGDVSPPATAIAPDLTAPNAPVATLDPTGAVVTGSGEAGAAITVRAADGTVLGTTTANANGDYAVTLNTVQDAGGTISVTQADAAGNVSPPANLSAPDFVAPDAPVATFAPDGSAVTGTGEAGATVTIRDTAGVVIGSAIVAADGSYSAPLATPQANGETVSVTLTDTAGNVSPSVDSVAPDITAPGTPTATLSGDGGLVAGTGEPGAIVTVTAPGGAVIGSATVGAGGSYVVTLATPQTNGETLVVTQADAAGNTSAPVSVVAADMTAPAAPTVVVNGDGAAVTGTGEPGATVTITDPAGIAIGTTLVDAGGTYTAQLSTAQVNGETLTATQADAAGNVSGIATTIAPDFTAPAPVDAAINGDGTIVSGTGEVGARIAVVDAAGTTVGTAIVAADGSFDVTLTPAQANGEALSVVQTDAAGNASAPLALTAPDITAPPAPDAALDPSGTIVTGTGEVGATVSVRDAGGTELGTAIVNAQGAYTVVLATPQVDSQLLSVVQTDAAGNTSVPTPLTASDLTAPDAPVATVGADGLSATGTGEVGATIVIRDPLGVVIGNAIVAADGTYTAALLPAQVDGEVLTVRQTDGAGNVSPPATTTAPDLVADTDPDAPTAAVGADGTTVAGTAIGGAVITVYDADGAVIANGVANADGSYSVALTPARIDGETIRVTQTEADGDVSPPATAVAPDLTAPIAPTAALDATGNAVTGTGEAGATITVRAANGTPLGTALVNADGFYAATLSTAQINGEVLSVTQADGAGNVSPPIALTASDLVVPTAPLASVNADGTAVTGTGEAGTTATVRDPAGVVIGTAIVAPDGSFTVPLAEAQDNGGNLTVTLTDAAGNVSAPVNALAPDITAPDVPTVAIAADGSVVTGVGEVGATVSVANANGAVIGTALVAADGSYSVALAPAQANGEALTVTQADAAGNASGPVAITAPDITVPTAPVASVVTDGTAVTGTGEAGTTATVRDAAGAVIGIAVVAPDGSFTVPLADAEDNGGTLTVTLTDAVGNVSAPAYALAPDITAPDVPTVAIAADGSVVTGVGEVGATVSVANANGAVIGTALVAADGSYSVTLTPAQANGEALTVSQADAAGNASGPVAITAPDITGPAAPVVTVSADGTEVSGIGEPGATVSIDGPTGATIATATVAADGTFVAVLSPAQANGEQLEAIQVDAAGNASSPTLVTAPDITAPAAPTLTITLDGTAANGTGEPGATVTVRNPDGSTIGTTVVAADGSYTLVLDPARIDGEVLSAIQNDSTGNPSPPVTATAPNFDAPVGLTADVSADGTTVTGAGEIGATVTIRDPAGIAIGTAVVGADGTYVATLTTAQVNGEVLSATQVDQDGNAGLPVAATAPDLTAPALPTADVNDTGTAVTGTGEVGATVTVTLPGGAVVATAIVGANGTYTATLTPAQVNGETLSVVQADPTGNPSPAATALAPDLTAPVAPTIAINGDGTVVSGTGEPGATVTITGPGGTPIGTVPVAGDGTYTITLGDPQINGETLTATQADPTGNVSSPASTIAPDFVTPPAPTAIVSGDGTIVTGTGEPGGQIIVTDPAGAAIGVATIGVDGTYSTTLSTPQLNGEVLSATQTDGGGNVSPPATALAPDLTAPTIPTLVIALDGASASGTGEPGATVTIVGPGGATIGPITVAQDGSYSTVLSPPQLNGQAFTATQADGVGNVSLSVSAVAPDTTAPDAPAAILAAGGGSVTGTGEAGATVRVSGPNGLLGTAVVAADGSFTVPLASAQANGQALTVIQTDRAGNGSLPTGITAPDTTAPGAPSAVVAGDGTSVTGTGEPGAIVTITAPGLGTIGTATVNADGIYTTPLSTPQANGEQLTVRQADAAGNVSLPSSVLAPDITAPSAPTATVSANGGFVTGTGEAGATVRVTGPDGGLLGTAIVAVDGTYAVPLSTAQTDSQSLTVTQTDRANNLSLPTIVVAPDDTAPFSPTATVSAEGDAVVGAGVAGATITVSSATGLVLGTATVGADGNYIALLDIAQRNGEVLSVVQSDTAGNVSPPVPAIAPDLTAPGAPSIDISLDGAVVTGSGEAGAIVTITRGGTAIGTAIVGSNGAYQITLAEAQRNGETLVATQRDSANNVSDPASTIAPDLTAPAAPGALVVAGDGTTVTGTGEPGARVEVRGSGGAVLGSALVAADSSFTVTLAPAQVTGVTLAVRQTDAAGNASLPGSVLAPFDIEAFDNSNTALIDLVPSTTPVNFGTAGYLALVSLGAVNLQAEVLSVRDVRFTVAAGHSLDAVFTYNALLDIGVVSGYAVVVQRFDGTNWVAVDGPGNASLLDIGLLNGNLSATETLGPGEYRAFLTFSGTAGVGLLGSLAVAGVDADFTAAANAVPSTVAGNVITDQGAGGAVDIVGPGTEVDSVTVNGTTTVVAANGTVVDGAWGTLTINLDGSYTYTPDASALAIGKTDVFTYTVIDPTDGERESATLSIAISSPDIAGAPVAAADVAVAAVTYDNVVATTAPTTAFSFNSQTTGLGLVSSGSGAGAFTVAPNSLADISITAVLAPGIALLPSYTLTVRNRAGVVVETATQTAVAGLPIGTGVAFAVDDLPAGQYTYTISSSALLTSFGTTVSVGATTTFLNQFTLATASTAEGNLLDNDTANTPFAGIRVNSGAGFAEVGDTAVVLNGQHGTLTVNETGDYLYSPNATLGYSTVDLFDTFTYQVIQPNGTAATSTLTVIIDVPADGTIAATSVASQMVGIETDVIALDAFLTPAIDADASVTVAPDSDAIGRAIYDVFEGQGELENVLANYLPPEPPAVLEGIGDAGYSTIAIDVAMPTVVDPLAYIVAVEDLDRYSNNTNSVY
jgi:VCBS repeat-containing protein